jgi:hypothetical protein
MMEGPSADSEEKHEPVSDIDTVAVESLKVLDPKRPIREADIAQGQFGANSGQSTPQQKMAVYSITSSAAAPAPVKGH